MLNNHKADETCHPMHLLAIRAVSAITTTALLLSALIGCSPKTADECSELLDGYARHSNSRDGDKYLTAIENTYAKCKPVLLQEVNKPPRDSGVLTERMANDRMAAAFYVMGREKDHDVLLPALSVIKVSKDLILTTFAASALSKLPVMDTDIAWPAIKASEPRLVFAFFEGLQSSGNTQLSKYVADYQQTFARLPTSQRVAFGKAWTKFGGK